MPKLTPKTLAARRANILDAAEICFARSGFHRTTMQDICREAGISAGALYVYFDSKEALIAGIAERNRDMLTQQIAELSNSPDLLAALHALGAYYTIEEPQHKRVLCVEIGVEATRNRDVNKIFRSFDDFVHENFVQLFAKAKAEGRINPDIDVKTLADVLCVLGDGLFWRRAIDPDFDATTLLPTIRMLIGALLNPTETASHPQDISDREASQ